MLILCVCVHAVFMRSFSFISVFVKFSSTFAREKTRRPRLQHQPLYRRTDRFDPGQRSAATKSKPLVQGQPNRTSTRSLGSDPGPHLELAKQETRRTAAAFGLGRVGQTDHGQIERFCRAEQSGHESSE